MLKEKRKGTRKGKEIQILYYWGTNYISLNEIKRLVLCVRKKRKPLDFNIPEFWLPCAMVNRLSEIPLLRTESPLLRGQQGLAGNCKLFFTLTWWWSVPLILDFFEWNLISECQWICNLWDNADEAYDCSSELNSKLLGLSKKWDETGFLGGDQPKHWTFLKTVLWKWMIFHCETSLCGSLADLKLNFWQVV